MGKDCKGKCPQEVDIPQTLQGWQVLDLVMRFSSQVRIASMSGQVVGFEMGAMISIAAGLGYDVPAVLELMPAAEWGMVAGLAKLRGGGDGEP